MNALAISNLRPGLLVSLKTTIKGNVNYSTQDIESDHFTGTGERKAKWETTRIINDPAEHEAAVKARGKARSLITSVCANSSFGLLCPEDKASDLDAAIVEAQKLAAEFNRGASLTSISVYVVCGRVAQDDVQAVRAINSEIRDLLADMKAGMETLDVAKIREAANKAKQLGSMLSPQAQSRIQEAIDASRKAARELVKAGEIGEAEIDRLTIFKIESARTSFLDLDSPIAAAEEIDAGHGEGRAVDFMLDEAALWKPTQEPSRPMELD